MGHAALDKIYYRISTEMRPLDALIHSNVRIGVEFDIKDKLNTQLWATTDHAVLAHKLSVDLSTKLVRYVYGG